MSEDTEFAAPMGGSGDAGSLIATYLQDLSHRFDKRFDRFDDRFDAVQTDIKGVDLRLARIEASDVVARVNTVEKDMQRATNRLTKIETLFLPITALGGALVAGLGTWMIGFLPNHA